MMMGLSLFVQGLKLGLFPLGETMAWDFAHKGSLMWLFLFVFALGFSAAMAEPALMAVADKAASVAAAGNLIEPFQATQADYALGLRYTIALSVSCALVIGVLRILRGWLVQYLDHRCLCRRHRHDRPGPAGDHRHRLQLERGDHIHHHGTASRRPRCGAEALITNPPTAGRPMWVYARKTMFCKRAATPRLNKVSGIMIKAGASLQYRGSQRPDRRLRTDRLRGTDTNHLRPGLWDTAVTAPGPSTGLSLALSLGQMLLDTASNVLPIIGVLIGFQVLVLR